MTPMGGGWLSPTVEMWSRSLLAPSLSIAPSPETSERPANSRALPSSAAELKQRMATEALGVDGSFHRSSASASTIDPLAERCDWMLGPTRNSASGAEHLEFGLF